MNDFDVNMLHWWKGQWEDMDDALWHLIQGDLCTSSYLYQFICCRAYRMSIAKKKIVVTQFPLISGIGS